MGRHNDLVTIQRSLSNSICTSASRVWLLQICYSLIPNWPSQFSVSLTPPTRGQTAHVVAFKKSGRCCNSPCPVSISVAVLAQATTLIRKLAKIGAKLAAPDEPNIQDFRCQKNQREQALNRPE